MLQRSRSQTLKSNQNGHVVLRRSLEKFLEKSPELLTYILQLDLSDLSPDYCHSDCVI